MVKNRKKKHLTKRRSKEKITLFASGAWFRQLVHQKQKFEHLINLKTDHMTFAKWSKKAHGTFQ